MSDNRLWLIGARMKNGGSFFDVVIAADDKEALEIFHHEYDKYDISDVEVEELKKEDF